MNEQQTQQQGPGNVVALREEHREVLRAADTDSWITVIADVAKLADYLANTEFVPRGLRGKPAATAAAMLYGREVGLPPMTSLNSTHVIEGTPSISAEMMRAMVLAEGHELEFVETTGAKCIVRGRRRGSDTWTTVEWTIDMARAAKLLGKDNWMKWPRRMLQARGSSELCELVFPDVIHGFKAAEELQDGADGDGPEDTQAPPTTVARQGGTRKRAAAKQVAPAPAQVAGPDDVPLPDEIPSDSEPAGKPEAPSPVSGEAASLPDAGASSDAGDGGSEPAGDPERPDESGSSSGSPDAEPQTRPAEQPETRPAGPPEPRPQGRDEPVDAELVGEDNEPPPREAIRAQLRAIHAMFGKLGLGDEDDRAERMAAVVTIVGRELESTNDLTYAEASTLLDTLGFCKGDRSKLDTLLAETRDQEAAAQRDAEGGA